MISLAQGSDQVRAIAGILAYLLLKVVRPLLKTMLPPLPKKPPSAARLTCLPRKKAKNASRSMSRPPANCWRPNSPRHANWRQQDPQLVANIIKDWMGANGS
jgi:flagellar M-ring protein FliF